MATQEQTGAWKKQIEAYKDVYRGLYPGEQPSDKLVESFCRINGIPWPLPDAGDEFDFLD